MNVQFPSITKASPSNANTQTISAQLCAKSITSADDAFVKFGHSRQYPCLGQRVQGNDTKAQAMLVLNALGTDHLQIIQALRELGFAHLMKLGVNTQEEAFEKLYRIGSGQFGNIALSAGDTDAIKYLASLPAIASKIALAT